MRWHILRTLLYKEMLRHLANRGGLILIVLLVGASLLLSLFGNQNQQASGLVPGVRTCYVDYWKDGPLVKHLKANVPPELESQIEFRWAGDVLTDPHGVLLYRQYTGAIQLRPLSRKAIKAPGSSHESGYKVWFWHPGKDGSALAAYEVWFWREAYAFQQKQAAQQSRSIAPANQSINSALAAIAGVAEKKDQPSGTLILKSQRSELGGVLDPRSGMATSLVLFGLFFVCVYLLPSLTCEERERGVLLAQALSPASPREILFAKFLFYPVVGLTLAGLLAGTYRPEVLLSPFFWLTLVFCVLASMGIGLTIASLARTQRAASMGALCYMLAVALLLFICQQNDIPGLPHLALEYHGPRILHAVLTDSVRWYHWGNLLAVGVLGCFWMVLASHLFRKYGWQT